MRQFFFTIVIGSGLYWSHLRGGYGSAGMRPERRAIEQVYKEHMKPKK